MRVKTSGVLRRIDPTPLAALVPWLLDEWARLDFDGSGSVINPISGGPVSSLTLLRGRHRETGSRYAVTIATPRFEPPAPRAALPSTSLVTVREDDSRHLAVTITDEGERWAIDVDIRHGHLPRVDLVGRVDLTAMIRGGGSPGCLARLFGGPGEARAELDLTTLEGRGGALLDAEGSANRFRGAGRANVETTAARWNIDGALTARARGLGRVVLLVAGHRLRRHIAGELERFWQSSEAWIAHVETDLRGLAERVDEEGGEAAFVHRALWDPGLDPTPPGASR